MTEEQERQQPHTRPFVAPGWRAVVIGGIGSSLAIVALVALHDPAPPPARFVVTGEEEVSASAGSAGTDPLMSELLRCRSLPAGSEDAACREAWEVNRRRFMGESRSLTVPAQIPPSPAAAGVSEGH